MATVNFKLYGKDYSFSFDKWQDDPAEGATLTYVGDENGRLRPSEHAHPDAWRYAEPMVRGEEVRVPLVDQVAPEHKEQMQEEVIKMHRDNS